MQGSEMAREHLTWWEPCLSQVDQVLPTDHTDWSCCWYLRENAQQGRCPCSLSVYHWQRAAAARVIDSFTNQSSCSTTKHQGSLPVYSLNGPKSPCLIGWLPPLSLSSYSPRSPLPCLCISLCTLLSFMSPPPCPHRFSSLLKYTLWGHAYLHNHRVQTLTIQRKHIYTEKSICSVMVKAAPECELWCTPAQPGICYCIRM